MDQVYKSKIDAWVFVALLGVIVVCLFTFIYSLRDASAPEIVITLPALLIGAVFPVWIMMSTNYTLGETALLIKSGPFKWQVPIAEITHIAPTFNPLSSPALSLDRIRIEYGAGKSVMISPQNRDQFIQDLEARRGSGGR